MKQFEDRLKKLGVRLTGPWRLHKGQVRDWCLAEYCGLSAVVFRGKAAGRAWCTVWVGFEEMSERTYNRGWGIFRLDTDRCYIMEFLQS